MVVSRSGAVTMFGADMLQAAPLLQAMSNPAIAKPPDAFPELPRLHASPGLRGRIHDALASRFPLAQLFHGAPAAPVAVPPRAVDYLTLEIDPKLGHDDAQWAVMRGDVLALKRLDAHSVHVIASAMSRSVALQALEHGMDVFSTALADLAAVISSGKLAHVGRPWLYSLLSRVNRVKDVVYLSNIGASMKPGSSAWNMPDRYIALAELLHDELELSTRLDELNDKLEHVDSMVKFGIHDVSEEQMERLEVLIVLILIAELIFTAVELAAGQHGHAASADEVVVASVTEPEAYPAPHVAGTLAAP